MPNHNNPGTEKQYIFSIILTGLILLGETGGGLWTGSLALLSDAGHVLTDIFALGLSYLAYKLSSRPPDDRHTYGYHRLEVLAALTNGASLGIISVGIFIEAWNRFATPHPIKSMEMLVIAIIGLVINIVVALILKHDDHLSQSNHQEDLNKKSAYLHVLGDAISSVGVILAAGIIGLTGIQIIDPIVSCLIACMIAFSSIRILRSSLHILIEGVPDSISLASVHEIITNTPGITDVHDLHIWNICSGHIALSAHVVIPNLDGGAEEEMRILKSKLLSQFGIAHTTIQIEKQICSQGFQAC